MARRCTAQEFQFQFQFQFQESCVQWRLLSWHWNWPLELGLDALHTPCTITAQHRSHGHRTDAYPETTMSMIAMTLAGMGAMIGSWVLHRRRVQTWRSPQPRQRPRSATIHVPMVIGTTNPRELAANGIRLWQLHGGPGCEFGQAMGNRRLRAEDTIPLPAPGCGRVDCRCIYQPVREARRAERRIASNDRRDMLRFDASDRRRNERRIRRNGWNEGGAL